MKMKFIDPDQIFGAVLALIILGVGVFATFTVFASIPATVPIGTANRHGNGTIYSAPPLGVITNDTDPILRFIPAPGAINNTAVCILFAEGAATVSGGFDAMYVLQAVGACNGTFIANGTYRMPGNMMAGGVRNSSFYLHYSLISSVTSSLSNSTYTAVLNVTSTSTQVFNIIGVVLIIAAVLAIVGLIYSYVRPRS